MNDIPLEIDVKKIVKTLKENFKALREEIDVSDLSEQERIEILEELKELKKIALKLKTNSAE